MSGSLLLALAVAAAAWLVAFLSPCVLPVVPGYVGYVSWLAGQSAVGPGNPPAGRLPGPPPGGCSPAVPCSWPASPWCCMILGGFAGALGYLLPGACRLGINRVAGAIVILVGLLFMGVFPSFSARPVSSEFRPRRRSDRRPP